MTKTTTTGERKLSSTSIPKHMMGTCFVFLVTILSFVASQYKVRNTTIKGINEVDTGRVLHYAEQHHEGNHTILTEVDGKLIVTSIQKGGVLEGLELAVGTQVHSINDAPIKELKMEELETKLEGAKAKLREAEAKLAATAKQGHLTTPTTGLRQNPSKKEPRAAKVAENIAAQVGDADPINANRSWYPLPLQEEQNTTSLKQAYAVLPKPPHTPGALLHIGKTGGSTVAKQLRNGCHSFVKKPCKKQWGNIHNESYISKLTTYIHVPDFEKLDKAPPSPYSKFEFYVVTLRDPYSKFLSAFTYQHPYNEAITKMPPREMKAFNRFFKPCFPTLESFADALGDDPDDYEYPWAVNVTDTSNCRALARATMHNQVSDANHMYMDTTFVWNKIGHHMQPKDGADDDTPDILAIRTEHMWDDWTTANAWLGQPAETIATFGHAKKGRSFNQQDYPVSKQISAKGQQRVCRSLAHEYEAYFAFIHHSANLTPQQKQASLDEARKNCPSLNLEEWTFTLTDN